MCNVSRPLRRALARSQRPPTVQISGSYAISHQVDTIMGDPVPVGGQSNTFDIHQVIGDGEENVLNNGDGGDGVEIENEMNEYENENENIVEPIVYCEGNFSTIKKGCLSFDHVYHFCMNLKHLSTLPLLFGECKVHYMGSLSYSCTHCDALAWKVEGVRIQPFVGKCCCNRGKVNFSPLHDPTITLKDLLLDDTARGKEFRVNIRGYNNAMAFASLGAQINERSTRGWGLYTFRVHGSIYHNIGALMPDEGSDGLPRFTQLYFYDTDHEIQNRLCHLSSLNMDVLHALLQTMIHEINPYAHALRLAAEMMCTNNYPKLRMVIKETRSSRWK